MNLSLLAKWCWRFGQEKNRLWYKILADKYGENFSSWIPNKVKTAHGVSCWKTIADTAHLVSTNSRLIIHYGTKISFWNDIWRGNTTISSTFPSLHKLATNKDAKIADMISTDGSWQFSLKLNLSGSEINSFAALLLVIGSNPPALDDLPDTRRWCLNSSGTFTVKSLYSNLTADYGVLDFPHSFVWKKHVPPKINFLVWCLIHEKLNTIDMLQIKGIDMYNSCVLCGDDMEFQDHLFLHCKITNRVWSSVLPREGWSWAIPRNMKMLALGWHQVHFSNTGNFLWSLIPAAIIYTIWTERNRRTFEQKYTFKTENDLGIEVKSLLLAWANASGYRIHLNFAGSILNNWDALFM